MKKILLGLSLVTLSCASQDMSNTGRKVSELPKLQWTSSLQETAAKGDGRFRYQMGADDQLPGVYMVGPEENFHGEVTVMDGKIYVSRWKDGKVSTVHAPVKMVFNVFARCAEFIPISLERVGSPKELQDYLKNNLSGRQSVLRFKGQADSAKVHIVNGIDPQQKKPKSYKQVVHKQGFEGVAFYSQVHRKVFTHHDSDLHIHAIDDQGHGYHVDDFKNFTFNSIEVCLLSAQ